MKKIVKISFLQLPVPPPAFFASTGNVPLASACLANAWSLYGLKNSLELEVIAPDFTDLAGDRMLVNKILSSDVSYLALSLYLWNSERSLYIAEQVKKSNPNIQILIGGPEVGPDNISLIEKSTWDYAVVGEAEDTFVELMISLLKNSSDTYNLAGLGYKNELGHTYFNPISSIDFPLSKYPSAYLSDFIKVDPFRSTYVETVRGCRSKCTYCFYPKSSNTLRSLTIEECKNLFIKLKEKGARELVFLDPTFNHRPKFEEFVDVLIDVNFDGQMKMFAELRAEGLSSKLIQKLKKAGFYRIEIGMQSINEETLRIVKRYGNPKKVAEVSKIFIEEGIDLLLDLIVGLPNDKPLDVLNGVYFFLEHGLGEYLQVFPLSVLPGTTMRAEALSLGLEFMKTPPYRILKSPNFKDGEIESTLLEVEAILDRRIDEVARPHLVEPHLNSLESIYYNLDKNEWIEPEFTTRHFQIWIETKNLDDKLELLKEKISLIVYKEPYSTIDFILYVDKFPAISLLVEFRKFLFTLNPNFQKFSLQHRGEDMQHRLVILLKESSYFHPDFLKQSLEYGYLYQDMKYEKAILYVKELGITYPNVRIIDKNLDSQKIQKIARLVDPEVISFANRELEKLWTLQYLHYAEQD